MIEWSGLQEFKAQLANLPAHLAGQAGQIVEDAGRAAEAELLTKYPTGPTGNLKRGLDVQIVKVSYGARADLTNHARHAWWYDNGTAERRTSGQFEGARSTGRMFGKHPPAEMHVFVRTAIRRRREMYRRLVALLRDEGFVVNDAGLSA